MSPLMTTERADTFIDHLRQALEHVTDSTWLGHHSPLAMPYFLGVHLWGGADADTAPGRGLVLRKLLAETTQLLGRQDADGAYAERVLTMSFFQPMRMYDLLDALGVGRSTYYRHVAKAIQQLAAILVRTVKPALRLETPLPQPIYGRDGILETAGAALREGLAVALTGSSGIGKTSLGIALTSRWDPHRVFWWTLRPGLNDHLGSLIFALGYFFHRQGASSVWLQLVADEGMVDRTRIFGLVRHDLEHLRATPPLLCFDEIDLLQPDEREDHGQILAFLESLRGLLPLLFISQRRMLEPDRVYVLDGLDPVAVQRITVQFNMPLTDDELELLRDYTAGNPRLFQLLLTLHRAGQPLRETLPHATSAPTLELLVGRIWRRLPPEEQAILTALAVFRRFAPADVWGDQQSVLQRLVAARLVDQDGQGGLAVMLALRPTIYALIPPEERDAKHLQAAAVRTLRSEYTAAAYHFLRGGQPETAIMQWYQHREQEIDQGQADAALHMFGQISHSHLSVAAAECLVLLRSELRMLAGEYDDLNADMQAYPWADDRAATVRARLLAGDVAMRTSQVDRALADYQAGLSTATILMEREVAQFHARLGMLYGFQRDQANAWREARLARYEAEHLQGYLQISFGNYAEGIAHYRSALRMAEELRYGEGAARTASNLAQVLAQRGEFAEAFQYWDQALSYYQASGNRSRMAWIKANQSGVYTDQGQSDAAIAPGEEALELYTQLGESQGQGQAAHNLAHAHFALGNFEAAAEYARRAIRVGQPGVRPYSLLTLAEICLAQGSLDEAEDFCRQSIELGERRHDQRICGYAWRVLGQVWRAAARTEQASEAFRQALELFQHLDLAPEIERTMALLAAGQTNEISVGREG